MIDFKKELADMEAEIAEMKAVDLPADEMAEKLNLIAAGLILLKEIENELVIMVEWCDPAGDCLFGHNMGPAHNDYVERVKPFAVALFDLKVGGLVEHVPLDNLLDGLDRLVMAAEEYEENGIGVYDKKAAEVIKKALRKRKRKKKK